MRILIADKLSNTAIESLKKLGTEVVNDPELTTETLPNSIAGFNILVVRSTKVNAAILDKARDLALVIRAGAGVNTIDLETASHKGILVANCPGKNTDAVAELAMGLLIAADRRIPEATADLRNGIWNKKGYSKAAGLKGRTLGIIGLGAIGRAVAQRAAAFGMDVCAWSRSLTPEKAEELNLHYCATPESVAERAYAVTVHLAASPETRHFIGKEFFARMNPGAIFINTSRGEIVDNSALLKAAASGQLRPALDVYEQEPAAGDKAFPHSELAAQLAAGTHHIGASTDQAAAAIAAEVVRIVSEYKRTGSAPNVVNLRDKSDEGISLVIRHYNHAGVLAGVLDELRAEDINIEEMQNSILSGAEAAVCTMILDSRPGKGFLEKIRSGEHIIQAVYK